MARSLFAGRAGDYVTVTTTLSSKRAFFGPPGVDVELEVWSAPENRGGVRLTDLQYRDGTATDTIAVSANAAGLIPEFYGPDGVVEVYVRDTEGDFYRLGADSGPVAAAAQQAAADAAAQVTAAQTARTEAETAASLARDISEIDSTDDAIDVALNLPGGKAAATLSASIAQMKAWAKNPDQLVTGAITYSSGLLSTAAVQWPDGASGLLTITARQAGTDAVTGYTITRVTSDGTTTYTQPTITRDSSGNATTVPQITVA